MIRGSAVEKYGMNSTDEAWRNGMVKFGTEAQSHQQSKSIDNASEKDWNLINKPPHYNKGGIEAIDYIKQQLGSGFKGYLEGNVLKYIHRHKYKNNAKQDLEKAKWYLERLIQELD
jgi:hypothetical protein